MSKFVQITTGVCSSLDPDGTVMQYHQLYALDDEGVVWARSEGYFAKNAEGGGEFVEGSWDPLSNCKPTLERVDTH